MNNIIFMHTLDSNANLSDVPLNFSLLDRLSIHLLIQILSRARLEKEVNIISISGKVVQVYYVWVIQVALNSSLSNQLIYALRIEILFFNYLEAIYSRSLDMLHQANPSIAPSINELNNFKHFLFFVYKQNFKLFRPELSHQIFSWATSWTCRNFRQIFYIISIAFCLKNISLLVSPWLLPPQIVFNLTYNILVIFLFNFTELQCH